MRLKMAALARQSTAFRDVFNQWPCSGLAVLSVRSTFPPQLCGRDLHADQHSVTTIPDQGKHCLEFFFFLLSLPSWIIDYWCKKKKKKSPISPRTWLHRPTLRWEWKSHSSQWAIWTLWAMKGMWRFSWKQWVFLGDLLLCSSGHCSFLGL